MTERSFVALWPTCLTGETRSTSLFLRFTNQGMFNSLPSLSPLLSFLSLLSLYVDLLEYSYSHVIALIGQTALLSTRLSLRLLTLPSLLSSLFSYLPFSPHIPFSPFLPTYPSLPYHYSLRSLWTGKQLFSLLVCPNSSSKSRVNVESAEKFYSGVGKSMCVSDGYVLKKARILNYIILLIMSLLSLLFPPNALLSSQVCSI